MPTPRLADVTRAKTDPRHGIDHYNVVFIPWDYADAKEWIDKTTQWNSVTAYKYEIVWYTGTDSSLIKHANDHPHASVYIRGHGAAGVADIQVKVGTPPHVVEKKIHITEACDRLIKSGLKTSFAGAIKFFHCYSGTVMTAAQYGTHSQNIAGKNQNFKDARDQGMITKAQYKQWKTPLLANKSIARTGADYMRGKGYRNCVYYGYLGPLESEYGDKGSHIWHKYTDLTDLQPNPAMLGTVRASLGRVQV
jgi:hypothetical protein